jgi:DNA-binding transcriptional LysR family regulator
MNVEAISLDQLRVVIAVAETGSFTSAAKRLRRVQSAVSQTVNTLEQQLGVALFDRSGYRPTLTPAGEILLASMRAIIARSDHLQAQARGIASGLEPEVCVVVDALYPIKVFARILAEFREQFPPVSVRLYVEALGGVAEKVLDGTCGLGVIATLPELPPGLTSRPMPPVAMVPIAAPTHPLAQAKSRISAADVQEHIQIVLSDRTRLTAGRDFLVVSPQTWRVADLSSKHELLRAGLGWGNMPLHLVEADLASGTLCRLSVETVPDLDYLPTYAIHRANEVLGPARRWMLDRLVQQGSGSSPPEAEGRADPVAAPRRISGAEIIG